jgi:Protein of unknown function (DUF1822)
MSLDLLLKLSEPEQQQIWQQTQSFGVPQERWNAYLNQLCLTALWPWLQEEVAQTQVWPNAAALLSFWALVNGTALTMGTMRLVLVPIEAIDTAELRVPQEWVDLPTWVADYYLAVQVEPDESMVRVWGYASHHQLKTQGHYDATDRTYSLTQDQVIGDLSVLWLTQQFGIAATNRTDVVGVSPIGLEQARNLINRLGNPAVITPRLAVPFALWGALLEHGGWRQALYERRQGLPEQRSVGQWLQTGIAALAQGWEQVTLQPAFATARGSEMDTPTLVLSRRLTITGQAYDLQILPTALVSTWRFELRPVTPGGLIPGGFKLRLLTEDLQPFPDHEVTATTAVEYLFLEVALDPGEGIVWEVEPLPEGHDREILRF